jgi:hypothetical protein
MPRFPFLDHLTLAEVATIERWRAKWDDHDITQACWDAEGGSPRDAFLPMFVAIRASKIEPKKIAAYLARNPRAQK